jgi:hypothetical protein
MLEQAALVEVAPELLRVQVLQQMEQLALAAAVVVVEMAPNEVALVVQD